jgi:hypothetical protein
MVMMFISGLFGPRSVLLTCDLTQRAESGRRRHKEALQQKRVERDHADRDTLYYRDLAKPFHSAMIKQCSWFGNMRVPFSA